MRPMHGEPAADVQPNPVSWSDDALQLGFIAGAVEGSESGGIFNAMLIRHLFERHSGARRHGQPDAASDPERSGE